MQFVHEWFKFEHELHGAFSQRQHDLCCEGSFLALAVHIAAVFLRQTVNAHQTEAVGIGPLGGEICLAQTLGLAI